MKKLPKTRFMFLLLVDSLTYSHLLPYSHNTDGDASLARSLQRQGKPHPH